jgi:branched-chain amino acid transport system substrate-binding protein
MTTGTWKVGVLFSETGVTAAIERTQRVATFLAIDQINRGGGIRGRLLEPIAYDPKSDPARYRDYARMLCDQHGVSVIFGCKMSSARKAVLPIVESRDALLFYPTLYEGFEYSQHCVYTGAAPNQNSTQLVDYLSRHFGNDVFLIGSNYVYPYESNRVVGDLFRNRGGKIVGEVYLPLQVTRREFDAPIEAIKKAQPDVIYSSLVGDGVPLFYEEYRRAGLDPRRMPIGSLSTSEAEVAQMAPGVAEGHVVAAPYFSTLATEENKRFIEAFSRFSTPPLPATSGAEAAWFQVHLFARALERCNDDHPTTLLNSIYDVDFDAPQGNVRVDRDNNHTYLWPRVGKANAHGTFDIVDDPGICVRPDPFMVDLQPRDSSVAEHDEQV